MDLERKILVAMLVLIVGSLTVYAIAPASNVNWISDTSYTPGAASASDVTEGGNITVLNITGDQQSTERWAGYLGNVSSASRIILANSDASSIFYNWTWDSSQGGEVCAGTDTSYTWASLAAAVDTNIDTAWGFGDVSDDAEATFDDGNKNFEIGGVTSTAPSADTGQSDGYYTIALTDNAGGTSETDFIFCTNITSGGTGYDGSTVDYEVIVPTSYGATETYYFYLEMN